MCPWLFQLSGTPCRLGGRRLAGANFGRKKTQKYRWSEHSISGQSMAGASIRGQSIPEVAGQSGKGYF